MHLLNRCGVVHALWIGVAACALPAAAAPTYSYLALDVAGATSSTVRALNDAGQAVGSATTAQGVDAALWSGGVGTLLPRPTDTLASTAYAINASGQVAGSTSLGMGRYMERAVVWDGGATRIVEPLDRAFGINASGMLAGEGPGRSFFLAPLSWRDGVATELPAAGGVTGSAYAVNDSGQVVGFNGDELERQRATLWSGSGMRDLGVFGAAHAVNASGQVAGVSWDEATPRAFLWSVQGLAWLDAPGAAAALAQGINDRGQVVGTGGDAALLWSEGVRHDLNDLLAPGALEPGWVLASAADINNQGWIVGDAYNAQTGQTRGYLLTPLQDHQVPEPRSLALVLLAPGALMAWRRRRAPA
jgi:probable HAF family extracellular repeat protein